MECFRWGCSGHWAGTSAGAQCGFPGEDLHKKVLSLNLTEIKVVSAFEIETGGEGGQEREKEEGDRGGVRGVTAAASLAF